MFQNCFLLKNDKLCLYFNDNFELTWGKIWSSRLKSPPSSAKNSHDRNFFDGWTTHPAFLPLSATQLLLGQQSWSNTDQHNIGPTFTFTLGILSKSQPVDLTFYYCRW